MKKNKNKYIYLFLVVLNLATILNIYVVSDFVKNKDFIISSLCVQKNKIINTCQGSCHLKRQLQLNVTGQSSQKKVVESIPQFNFINSISFIETISNKASFHFYVIAEESNKMINFYHYFFTSTIFNPPVFVS